MKKLDDKTDSEILRQKAEELFHKKAIHVKSDHTDYESLKLIQELEIHQIELEIQNLELLLAKERAEVTAQKYTDLYDFAPNGYFTLSEDGRIIDLNLSGEKMLGKERLFLINSQFVFFVSKDTKKVFQFFIENIFSKKTKETCELTLLPEGCLPLSIHLTGVISVTSGKCLVTAVDITERKELINLNEVLLSSLPYPAMYIRGKDKVILSANKNAIDLGVKIGGHCWREFGKSKFISDKEKKIAEVFPDIVPNNYNIKCSFCLADKCTSYFPNQNSPEVNAFGQIWDTYWIKVGNDVFLHYAIDITENKREEAERRFLSAAVENSDNFVVVKDLNLRIVAANKAWLNLNGNTSIKDVLGKTDAEVFGISANSDPIRTYMEDDRSAQKLSQGECIIREEPLILANGKTIIAITKKYPIFDNEGNLFCTGAEATDITERKKAELQLVRNLKFTEALLKSIPIPVFYKDSEGNYIGCNEAFTLQMGVTNDDIKGKTVMDLWPSQQAEIYHQKDIELLSNPDYQTYESKLTDKEKQIRDVIYAKNVFYDEIGQVAGIVGTYMDITDRKLIEDALKRSEDTFRTVADYTTDWEFWIDQNDNFLYCSPSCEKITGYKSIDFTLNPQLVFDIIYPEDLKIFQKHKQKEKMAQMSNHELEFRIVRLDGEIRWIGHVCQSVFNKSDEFIGIRGSDRDITERKETEQLLISSEHKYKLLSENITDGIFICRNGCFEFVNQGMKDIFGFNAQEMDGLKLLHLVKPDSQGYLEKFIISNSLFNLTKNIEIDCIKKDTSTIYVELLLNYVANEKVIYGVVHDITQKKQIQQKSIVKAIIHTEEKEKAHFSKELHDGLGPLLSTIKLYLQWTIRLKSIKKRNEIILKAEAIVEDALATVKEISNKLSPHLLAHYGLTSALQSFANKIEETSAINITLESNVTRRIDMEIEAAIYRAMIECINNTIKYANANNIYILVNDIGNQILINFRDDGIGFNLIETMAEQKGLGLFNLQNRIQTIGGKIDMNSEINHGVNYQIVIPL